MSKEATKLLGRPKIVRWPTPETRQRFYNILQRPLWILVIVLCVVALQPTAGAAPFGQGTFGSQVPFGSATSLSIALGGNVSLALVPSGANFTATGSHTITVTSTDVVGYSLYVHSVGSTNMTNGSSSIPTSANGTPGPLALNSWGYNTDGSSNFIGMKTSPTLIKNASGPYENGDNTTVTYGVLTSIITGAGNYNLSVVYTAVAQSQ